MGWAVIPGLIRATREGESVCNLCCYTWTKHINLLHYHSPRSPITSVCCSDSKSFVWLGCCFRRFAFTIWRCPGREGWMKVFSVFTDPALCPPAPTTSHPADAFHLHRANQPGSLNCIQHTANVKDTGESHTHTYTERPLKWTERFILFV